MKRSGPVTVLVKHIPVIFLIDSGTVKQRLQVIRADIMFVTVFQSAWGFRETMTVPQLSVCSASPAEDFADMST